MTMFKITDFGTPEVLMGHLRKSSFNTINMMDVMSRIVLDMMKIEKTIFSSSGRRGGGSWKRLKPETIARKGGDTRILRHTNVLEESLTEPGAPFQILEMYSSGFEFGTSRPWSFVHQYGSSKMHVPRRQFIKFLPTDYRKWTRWVSEHVVEPFQEPTIR